MFGSFRAGGFAAATFVLSASMMGAGHSQALDLAVIPSTHSPAITTDINGQPIASALSTESPQLVLPVQSAPSVPQAQPAPLPQSTLSTSAPSTGVAPVVAPVAIPPAPVVRKERATLAQLVAAHRSSVVADRERECLAGAIYFESKGEPLSGQVAVGQVIANRAKSGRFPKSYCGVVFQRSQFSFVRGRALPPIPRSSPHWKTAVAVAHIVANELHDPVAPKSLFFHARYVSPNWKRMSRVATVGNHVFYR